MADTQYDIEDLDRPLVDEDYDKDFFSSHPDIKKMQEDDDFRKWGEEMGGDSKNPKEKDSDELQNDEETGGEIDEETSDEQSSVESLNNIDDIPFNPDVTGRVVGFGSFVRKRGIAFGLLAAGLLGGGLITFSLISGPLQFIHIAKLLQQFHFTTGEDMSDQRFGKFVRYLRDPSRPERTRMGIVGNKLADTFELKMNKSGISSVYKGSFGSFDGYRINLDTYDNGSLKNVGNVEARKQLQTKLGLENIEFDGTNFRIPPDGLSVRGNRKLTKLMLKEAGYSKIGAAIRARTMGKRSGVPWHPIKKLDAKILGKVDDLIQAVKTRRANSIERGSTDPAGTVRAGEGDTGTNEDGTNRPATNDATKAAADANEVSSAGDGAVTGAEKAGKIKGAIKKAGGISAVIGITCAVKGIADNIDDLKHDLVVLPLIRMGMEAITVGNQIMTGQDLQMEQLAVLSEKLNTAESGSWVDSGSMQYELNQPVTGPGIPSEARIPNDQNAVSQFMSSIPGLGTICSAVNTVFGGLVMSTIDVVGGPLSAVFGVVAGQVVIGPLLSKAIDWLAGSPINTEVAGADYGSYINLGARLASNETMIASGGRKLSNSESLALRGYRNDSIADDQSEKNIFAKYLDIKDPRSAIASVIDRQSTNPVENVAMIFKAIPKNIASLVTTNPLLGKAKAQSETRDFDYGIEEYGFSLDEINSPDLNNPYQVNDDVYTLINGPDGDSYIEKAKKCFNVTISKSDLSMNRGSEAKKYKEIDDSCSDTDLAWTKVRMTIFDTSTVEAMSCYEGDENSCDSVGFTSTGASASSTSGSTGPTSQDLPVFEDMSPCPTSPDIKDAGIGKAVRNDLEVSFRLCRILDTATVNVVYANNFLGLFKGARDDGHNLAGGGGSFVSIKGALDRWKERCGDRPISAGYAKPPCVGNQIAPPGKSNHEIGLAVDLTCEGAPLGGGTDTRNEFDVNDPCVSWVRSNSKQFGLVLQCDRVRSDGTQSEDCESWHISPTGG